MQIGVWGSAVSSPNGVWAEPQQKSNLVYFSLKIWHLVEPILLIFLTTSTPPSLFLYKFGRITITRPIFSKSGELRTPSDIPVAPPAKATTTATTSRQKLTFYSLSISYRSRQLDNRVGYSVHKITICTTDVILRYASSYMCVYFWIRYFLILYSYSSCASSSCSSCSCCGDRYQKA